MSDAPLVFGYVSQEASALMLSALVAIGLGWWAVWHDRQIAKSRLTFETLMKKNWDKDYLESFWARSRKSLSDGR